MFTSECSYCLPEDFADFSPKTALPDLLEISDLLDLLPDLEPPDLPDLPERSCRVGLFVGLVNVGLIVGLGFSANGFGVSIVGTSVDGLRVGVAVATVNWLFMRKVVPSAAKSSLAFVMLLSRFDSTTNSFRGVFDRISKTIAEDCVNAFPSCKKRSNLEV